MPPNARSHTVLLSGKFPGDESALARLQFGQDAQRQVRILLVLVLLLTLSARGRMARAWALLTAAITGASCFPAVLFLVYIRSLPLN